MRRVHHIFLQVQEEGEQRGKEGEGEREGVAIQGEVHLLAVGKELVRNSHQVLVLLTL